MTFLRINQTVSFWTAHSASWTAQNWLDCTVRIYPALLEHVEKNLCLWIDVNVMVYTEWPKKSKPLSNDQKIV